jgi:hypothetical protein
MHDLLTTADMAQWAKQHGRPVTESYLRRLFRDRRIPGAFKVGTTWAMPASYADRWLQEWTSRTQEKDVTA